MKKLAFALMALTAAAAAVPFLTNENEDEKEYFALTWYARKDKKNGSNGFTVDLLDPHRTVEGILRAKAILEAKKGGDACGCAEAEEAETAEEAPVDDGTADTDAVCAEPEEA